MKYMIISDIHGSFEWVNKAIEQFNSQKADVLLILGDVLYHGPRNALPHGHDPQQASDILNQYAEKIIAVRGNCDAEVDQVMLKFPCLSDYTMVVDDGRTLFLTHGHLFDEDNLPFKLSKGDIYFSGHTHIWRIEQKKDMFFCNPGSISLPKVAQLGDSMNDEAMLRWAGWGVAMVNGDERIRNCARLVTEYSNDDDGVAKTIEKYVLGH